jgi:hypothetical protein
MTSQPTTAMWTLKSGEVWIETHKDDFIDPEPDPKTHEGRAVLNGIATHMLGYYGKNARRMARVSEEIDENGNVVPAKQPALAAFAELTAPSGRAYLLPTLQLILEMELPPEDFVVDRISWIDCRIGEV